MANTLKEEAKRYLADVPVENAFQCYDGNFYRNMKELRDGLTSMSEEIYAYHVNANKNDFSKWVRDIIKDENLASDLQNSASRTVAVRRISSRITILSRR